jgi:addiction module HigA family antidote
MQPLGIEAADLARALKVPIVRLRRIIEGRRSIDTIMALRLARYFDSTAEFWLNLQAAYDLRIASELAAQIAKEVRPRKAA